MKDKMAKVIMIVIKLALHFYKNIYNVKVLKFDFDRIVQKNVHFILLF